MAKRKSKAKKNQPDLVYTEIDVPAPGDLLLDEFTSKRPADTEGEPDKSVFIIKFNAKTIERAQMYTDALIVARGLPAVADDLPAMTDPVALFVNQSMDWVEPGDEPSVARTYYQRQHQECNRDGLMIAMCDSNKFLDTFEPKEYTEEDTGIDPETPDWLVEAQADISIPDPKRNLSNPYERRLKLVVDFVDVCGILFAAQFNTKMNQSMSKVLRLIGEDADADGFPKVGADK